MIPGILPAERQHPLTLSVVAGNVVGLLRDGAYLGFVLAVAAGYAAFMVYIGVGGVRSRRGVQAGGVRSAGAAVRERVAPCSRRKETSP